MQIAGGFLEKHQRFLSAATSLAGRQKAGLTKTPQPEVCGITSHARKVQKPRKNGTRHSGVPAECLPTDAGARKAEQGTATAPSTRLCPPGRKNLSPNAVRVSPPAGIITLGTTTLPKKPLKCFLSE